MLRFALTQMRSSVGRLIAAGVAIVLGTGFIAATFLSSAVLTSTAESAVTAKYAGADVVVAPAAESISAADAAAVRAAPGVRAVDVQLTTAVIATAGGPTRYTSIQSLPTVAESPRVQAGQLPTRPDEIAVAPALASAMGVRVGDKLGWRPVGSDATRKQFTITAIVTPRSAILRDPPAWVTVDGARQIPAEDGEHAAFATMLLVYSDGSQAQEQLADGLRKLLGGDKLLIESGQSITDREVERSAGDAQFFVWFGMGFAAVAIIVAAMVIANTFEVLVAQRAKTLALLRCAGATKAQVRRSVLIEAVILSVAASVVGVLAGLGLAQAAVMFIESQDFGIATPSLADLDLAALWVPVVVGVAMTVLAAVGPARAATRVSPVAALRPLEAAPARAGGMVRAVLGTLVLLVGLVALVGPAVAIAWFLRPTDTAPGDLLAVMLLTGIAGGLLVVGGFLILAVFLVPPVVRVLGAALGAVVGRRRRATVKLATANAVRNPRRIATTASALVIGVGLVVMMGTGAASARATLMKSLAAHFPADIVVSATGEGLSAKELQAIDGTEGVVGATRLWSGQVGVDTTSNQQAQALTQVVAGDPQQMKAGLPGHEFELSDNTVTVSAEGARKLRVSEGQGISLSILSSRTSTGTPDVPTAKFPVHIQPNLVFEAAMTQTTYAKLVGSAAPSMVAVSVGDGDVSAINNRVQQAVSEASPTSPARVQAPAELRETFDRVIDTLLAVLLGLLGVAVIIALVGVANTLALSVIERRREHGVLRAVGMTRRQLRGALGAEAVLISVTGALVGIVIGLLCGWCGAAIVLSLMGTLVLTTHWWVLGGCLIVALVAGLAASVLPARSAVTVAPVVALADE